MLIPRPLTSSHPAAGRATGVGRNPAHPVAEPPFIGAQTENPWRALRLTKSTIKSLLVAAACLAPLLSRAQSGGQFEITRYVIAGGGGSSSGGQFALSGTVGQPAAGTLTGGNFKIEGGFWSGVQVLQVAGAPLLRLKLVGTNAVISWPASVTGFTLQETASLSPASWAATPQPVVDTASEHTVIVPAAGQMKWFRLKN